MNAPPIFRRGALAALAAIGSALISIPATALAGEVEVLTRGPVHEAFAETIAFNPQPAVVVMVVPTDHDLLAYDPSLSGQLLALGWTRGSPPQVTALNAWVDYCAALSMIRGNCGKRASRASRSSRCAEIRASAPATYGRSAPRAAPTGVCANDSSE